MVRLLHWPGRLGGRAGGSRPEEPFLPTGFLFPSIAATKTAAGLAFMLLASYSEVYTEIFSPFFFLFFCPFVCETQSTVAAFLSTTIFTAR